MTITEALAEVKTIQKRIEKKRQFVREHLGRQEQFKDPLEKEGGSADAVRRALQAIHDLEERTIQIRIAVHRANLETKVRIGESERSIQEWLTWRREIVGGKKVFFDQVASAIGDARKQAQQRGVGVVTPGQAVVNPGDVIIHLSEIELAKDRETIETVLGELDGQLSLRNATTAIDVGKE
jgi:hypothetical protein